MIVERCVRARQPYPDAIANAPELEPGLNLFYMAFLDLTSCRTLGYAQGPIPWLAIHHYCEAHGIEGEQREDVFHHVSALDKAYLDRSAEKTSKSLSKDQPPAPKAPVKTAKAKRR
jgi:hypothetical protein